MTAPGIYTIKPSFAAIEPDWVGEETWEVFPVINGQQRARVTGRVRVPASVRLNIFGNSAEPASAPKQAWFEPGQDEWKREVSWAFRNPMENFKRYVIGVCDQNYEVIGEAPVLATTWNDCPSFVDEWKQTRTGYKSCKIILQDGTTRDFTSYCSASVTRYSGTQWWGKTDVKWIGMPWWW